MHVSDGRVHVGTALTLASFAILLSGTLAYAASDGRANTRPTDTSLATEIHQLRAQVNELQANIQQIHDECSVQVRQTQPTPETVPPTTSINHVTNDGSTGVLPAKTTPPAPAAPPAPDHPSVSNPNTAQCLNTCEDVARVCSARAGKNAEAQQTCTNDYQSCVGTCRGTNQRR